MPIKQKTSNDTARPAAKLPELGLDRLSLEQALIDVEVANRRVIELTRRLAGMSKELAALRSQLSGSHVAAMEREVSDLRAQLAALRLQKAREMALTDRAG